MKKLCLLSLLSATICLGLFGFMAFLVGNDKTAIFVPKPIPLVEVNQTPPDTKVNEIVRSMPKLPEPMENPPSTQPPDVETNDEGIGFEKITMELKNIGTKINALAGSTDADARPVVRINPKYPPTAARDGKEGWVKLLFNINEIGGVFNIRVIDAQPKRIFNKAAKQALKKWKYRAKLADGKPIIQENLSVQLDFKMES